MLKNLKLENFRNHKNLELDLFDINIIIGPNGAGKSNILESVSLLSYCRSYREEDKKNLISFDTAFTRIRGNELEVFIQKDPIYTVQVKEKSLIRRQSDFIGKLKSVVFSPEIISLLTDSPKNRRKFLDIAISQKDNEYLQALIHYEKVRRERNSLLAMIAERNLDTEQLDFWDNEIIKWGSVIIKKRLQAIDFLSQDISFAYSEISDNKNDLLNIEYIPSVINDFLIELRQSRGREVAAKRTLIGPHRDDFVLKLNGTNINNFASRGEVKTSILSLKIAELNFLSDNGKGSELGKPILLLDDVFSEFDETRRGHLSKVISRYQTIITTTDESYISKEILKKTNIIKLNKTVGSKQ